MQTLFGLKSLFVKLCKRPRGTQDTSSTSEFIERHTVAEDAKKEDFEKQLESESTVSSFESTQTVTTTTQNIKESSEQNREAKDDLDLCLNR